MLEYCHHLHLTKPRCIAPHFSSSSPPHVDSNVQEMHLRCVWVVAVWNFSPYERQQSMAVTAFYCALRLLRANHQNAWFSCSHNVFVCLFFPLVSQAVETQNWCAPGSDRRCCLITSVQGLQWFLFLLGLVPSTQLFFSGHVQGQTEAWGLCFSVWVCLLLRCSSPLCPGAFLDHIWGLTQKCWDVCVDTSNAHPQQIPNRCAQTTRAAGFFLSCLSMTVTCVCFTSSGPKALTA